MSKKSKDLIIDSIIILSHFILPFTLIAFSIAFLPENLLSAITSLLFLLFSTITVTFITFLIFKTTIYPIFLLMIKSYIGVNLPNEFLILYFLSSFFEHSIIFLSRLLPEKQDFHQETWLGELDEIQNIRQKTLIYLGFCWTTLILQRKRLPKHLSLYKKSK